MSQAGGTRRAKDSASEKPNGCVDRPGGCPNIHCHRPDSIGYESSTAMEQQVYLSNARIRPRAAGLRAQGRRVAAPARCVWGTHAWTLAPLMSRRACRGHHRQAGASSQTERTQTPLAISP